MDTESALVSPLEVTLQLSLILDIRSECFCPAGIREESFWIGVLVCTILVGLACILPLCGRMHNHCSRALTNWVCTRLQVFLCFVIYFDLPILMLNIGILPDWIVNEIVAQIVIFMTWILAHLERMTVSPSILSGLYLRNHFRERLSLTSRVEHVTVVPWN